MIENHFQCKYCDVTFPKGCYDLMLDHLKKKHTDKSIKMILLQYREVVYVPASERKKDITWIPLIHSKDKVTR